MSPANPWKSYRHVATQTAPPGQLILMLFDGALRFLESGLAGFKCADPAEANMAIHNNFQRALDIIRELNRSVNLEQGGECAQTFRQLYDYFERKIVESNIKKVPDGAKEVVQHLAVLRDAWAMALTGKQISQEEADTLLARTRGERHAEKAFSLRPATFNPQPA